LEALRWLTVGRALIIEIETKSRCPKTIFEALRPSVSWMPRAELVELVTEVRIWGDVVDAELVRLELVTELPLGEVVDSLGVPSREEDELTEAEPACSERAV
jgi:hypothetical protein